MDDAVALEEAAGLEIVTDGEMRRARRGTRRQSALIACATLGPYPPANCWGGRGIDCADHNMRLVCGAHIGIGHYDINLNLPAHLSFTHS